jgi:hypothetical protein
VIDGEFQDAVGAKAIGVSHGDVGFVIQALHDITRKQLLRPEIVEDELAVLMQQTGDRLYRLDAGPQALAAPFIEEVARPGGRVVIPEVLESFLQQVRADGLQVVAEQID